MNFLLGVLTGALLVSLPLVALIVAARINSDMNTITKADMEIRAIKRAAVERMLAVTRQGRAHYDVVLGEEDFS